MNTNTKKLIITALMTALTCVATIIIKIPSPLKGYINLGDCFVLIAGWILGWGFGFISAGLGSALADIISGYFIYSPATFIIKGLMAVIAFLFYKLLQKQIPKLPAYIISGLLAELFMIIGYYVFEGFLYGFTPSIVNVPGNCIQAAAGLIIGVVVIKILDKFLLSKK